VLGDVKAMIGAEQLGAERLRDFFSDYGGGKGFQDLAEEILDRAIEHAQRTDSRRHERRRSFREVAHRMR